MASDVDLDRVARGTPGFAGADLENLVNEAALNAARMAKSKLTMEDFEFARDKVMMGAERKSMVISEEEKRNTAFHEAGHALVSKMQPKTDPIHKVTIIPRGMALGLTMMLPEKDRLSFSKSQAEAKSLCCLVAERPKNLCSLITPPVQGTTLSERLK
jgi:cell division protease FtsH